MSECQGPWLPCWNIRKGFGEMVLYQTPGISETIEGLRLGHTSLLSHQKNRGTATGARVFLRDELLGPEMIYFILCVGTSLYTKGTAHYLQLCRDNGVAERVHSWSCPHLKAKCKPREHVHLHGATCWLLVEHLMVCYPFFFTPDLLRDCEDDYEAKL